LHTGARADQIWAGVIISNMEEAMKDARARQMRAAGGNITSNLSRSA
jgi:hypothetical protein